MLSKCVSLSNSSRKTHLYRRRKTCTNVYFCRIHEEGHICTAAERAVQMCISVQIHQERQIWTDAETAVQMCIPVEFIKKDTFAQTQKELYKCVSLSNSSRKTHLYRRRNSCTNLCPNSSRKTHLYRCRKSYTNVHLCPNSSRKTHLYRREKSCTKVYLCLNSSRKTHLYRRRKSSRNLCPKSSRKTHLYRRRKSCTKVYLCRIRQERHICTGAERAVQMWISVECINKDTFVQVQKELYKCVLLSKFIKKDTLVQA